MPFSESKAQYVVNFIEKFCTHTTGEWAGKPFILLPWQKKVVREVFGTLKPDGSRQYQTVYIEIPKKNGKSELGAAIALYLLIADKEAGARVFSAASDRDQAGIVYGVAADMVKNSPDLSAMANIIDSTKRIVTENGVYRVLSSEAFTKHGYNISGVIFDELHTQPNRELFDVLTKGSGFARKQPLYWIMTTAGTDRNSICWEIHQKAEQILKGIIEDPTFYPVIYTLEDEEDWEAEENWYKVNPSLGTIIDIEKFRDAHRDAVNNLADENTFRQLHLDQWVSSVSRWIPLKLWDDCKELVKEFEDRNCYVALDLSTTTDLTAMAMVSQDGEYYDVKAHFWIPSDTAKEKERKDKVPYHKWVKQGYITLTDGNVIDYEFVKAEFIKIAQKYHVKELTYDPYNAIKMIQDLERDGVITVDPKENNKIIAVPFRQGWVSMSPACKDFEIMVRSGKIRHGDNPVLRWNFDNVVVTRDKNDNLQPNKAKAIGRIDGIVATIMALDRAIKHKDENGPSVYEARGPLIF